MNKILTVLLVEDDDEFAFLVQKKISKDDRLVFLGHASDKDSCISMAKYLKPDVVVMDLSLSSNDFDGTEGIKAAKEIRITTDAKIVFLTAHDDSEIIKKASKKAFASGYILKSQHQTFNDDLYHAAVSTTTPLKEFIKECVLSDLTHAERAVLDGILKKNIIGNTDILSGLSSTKTIANQKSSILAKLELKNEKELVKVFSNW
jgi:DNA-binding NarL/FixJ family response regulator